jgi:hypothetical protein
VGVVAYLAQSHSDSAVVSACGHTARCALSYCGGNASFWWAVDLVTTSSEKSSDTSSTGLSTSTSCTTSAATKETAKELTLLLAARLLDVVLDAHTCSRAGVRRRGSTLSHEGTNHNSSIDVAVTLCAAKRTSLSTGDFAVPDDGSIGLRTAAAKRSVSDLYVEFDG